MVLATNILALESAKHYIYIPNILKIVIKTYENIYFICYLYLNGH
jgi:hypothetical protein